MSKLNTLPAICFILMLISATYCDKCVLLVGPTRSGKDSLIDTLCKQKIANPGKYEDYWSITTKIERYDCLVNDEPYTFYNVPGFGDNNLIFTDQEIQAIIQEFFILNGELQTKGKIDAILVMESLVTDGITLKTSLSRTFQMLGKDSQDSMILLGNKAEQAKLLKKLKSKSQQISEELKGKNIPYLLFDTLYDEQPYYDEEKLRTQQSDLIKLINERQPYFINGIQKILKQIEVDALQMQEEAPKIESTVEIEYEATFLEPYETTEPFTDTKYGVVGYGERDWLLFGAREEIMGLIPFQNTRKVTKYRSKTEIRTKLDTVFTLPDLE